MQYRHLLHGGAGLPATASLARPAQDRHLPSAAWRSTLKGPVPVFWNLGKG